jgi:hypothetical protein
MIWPVAWLSLFNTDPAMLRTGSQYLHIVGPVAAQFLRLLVAVGGSAIALRLGDGVSVLGDRDCVGGVRADRGAVDREWIMVVPAVEPLSGCR